MSSSTDIKAADVQKLRVMTGAGLMDCKRALADSNGDMEAAIKILREKGIAKSSKRADHVAGEGLVEVWQSPDLKEAILLELNCETDFVARTPDFISLIKSILTDIQKNPKWADASHIPQGPLQEFSAKIGEKIEARRFARMSVSQGVIGSYIHAGSKLGVLVKIETNKPADASSPIKDLSKELALQVAGASPLYVSPSEVPGEIVEREKEIARKQLEGQKKPPEIIEKIAQGKLQQFYAQQCLLEQPYVRESSGKVLVKDLVNDVSKKETTDIRVVSFVRFRVGAE